MLLKSFGRPEYDKKVKKISKTRDEQNTRPVAITTADSPIKTCPHFDVLDEFLGSRDIVDQLFLVETELEISESATSTTSPVPSTSSSIA